MPDYANLCPVHVRALTHWREEHRHESDEDHAERVEHHRIQCRACLQLPEKAGLARELPMSKPRITAHSGQSWQERRVWGKAEPIRVSPAVEVVVEFVKGEHEAALAALERHVEDVKAQIEESHAPTWDGPRKVGEE